MNKKELREKLYALEDANKVEYEIGHRGGSYGLFATEALDLLGIDAKWEDYLPNKVGAFCNYLGGGLRGSINRSNYSADLPISIAKKVDQLLSACEARYKELEDNSRLNAEEDEDGETNWDALGTKRCRNQGVVSSY